MSFKHASLKRIPFDHQSYRQIAQGRYALPLHRVLLGSILLTQALTLTISNAYAENNRLEKVDVPAIAQSLDSNILSLEQALAQVKKYQSSQGLLETQQYIGQAALAQSKLWDNPTVSVEQTGFQNDQDKELAISISQPLDIFGQRRAAQGLAQASISKIDLQQQIYAAQLDLIVRHQWNLLVILQQEKILAQAQIKVSQENFQVMQKRYQAGSIAQVDVDRVNMAHLENLRAFQHIELQEKVTKRQLAKLWGGADISFQAIDSLDSLLSTQLAAKIGEYLNQNFIERSFQLDQQQNQAEIRYLKSQSRPNPTLSLGVNRTQSPMDQTESQMVLGVEIPLQVFNRQQYSIGATKAKLQALDRQRQFSREQVQLEVEILLAELKGLVTQYQQISDQQIPLAAQIQQKTLQGFEAGKFSVTDVQQATTQLQDVRLRKVQLLRAIEQRAVSAQSLSLGISPDRVIAADAMDQLNQTLWQDLQSMSATIGE